jgi:hypothetical protein
VASLSRLAVDWQHICVFKLPPINHNSVQL